MMKRTKTPKGQKRERTRAVLIAAAAELAGEKGFEKTSLEDVAARAGMTRGAIYGNFRDREALLLAVAEAHWAPISPPIMRGVAFNEQMRELGRAVAGELKHRRERAAGAASFQVMALTNKKLRVRLAKANAEVYRRFAEHMRKTVRPGDLPASSDVLVKVLHGLIDGLAFLHALTPELVDEDVVRAAFEIIGSSRK